ncbi:hypothetical protein B566_EDAN018556 [Ephemera danica]|nr:hypothetical protein B566_EDAN018556 [Ephemera danica]
MSRKRLQEHQILDILEDDLSSNRDTSEAESVDGSVYSDYESNASEEDDVQEVEEKGERPRQLRSQRQRSRSPENDIPEDSSSSDSDRNATQNLDASEDELSSFPPSKRRVNNEQQPLSVYNMSPSPPRRNATTNIPVYRPVRDRNTQAATNTQTSSRVRNASRLPIPRSTLSTRPSTSNIPRRQLPASPTNPNPPRPTSPRASTSDEQINARRRLFVPDAEERDNFVGKDGSVWGTEPPTTGRTRNCDILRQRGGRPNVPDTHALVNPVDALMLFLQPILGLIVQYTNLKAQRVYEEKGYSDAWNNVDEIEICAFIGLVMIAGALRQPKHTYTMLWNARYGPLIFRATLSLRRFKQILRFMRFDDTETRDKDDKLSPIREVWEIVNNLLGQYYIPSENLTVDEQLVAFRGRVGFRQYMRSKPAKYGMKIWHVCDAKNSYPLKALPYLGKEANQRAAPGLGRRVVETLVQPYFGSGRNVTCDNFFTDLQLLRTLLQNKLTLVGTLKQNKTCIPPEFKPNREREAESSLFGFQNDVTMVSYVPAVGKCVILLSSHHHDDNIVEVKKNKYKPEIIDFYNKTKGGVDSMDQKVNTYTTRRKSRRWTMAYFYNLVDIMGLAAYIIWIETYPHWQRKNKSRRLQFLLEVAESLTQRSIDRRHQTCRSQITKRAINQLRNLNQTAGAAPRAAFPVGPIAAKRCYVCPRSHDRKVKSICSKCQKHVCVRHSRTKRKCDSC